MKESVFNREQKEFLVGLGMTMGLRQLSMVILMPLLPIYASTLSGSNSFLSGIAIGAFGLFQAFFMVPYGKISDKKGRKPVIMTGLIILIIGILFGAFATNIYMLIISRALQGSGAIMSVCFSWISDSITDDKKNRALSVIGMAVGIACTLGFLGGAVLTRVMSIPSIFIVCGILVFASFVYIAVVVKEEKKQHHVTEGLDIKFVFTHPQLLKLTVIGLIINFTMIAAFFIVPNLLKLQNLENDMWKVFVPAILVGVFAMRVGAKIADKGKTKSVILIGFILFVLSGFIFLGRSILFLVLGMTLYMTGYMIVNTIIPGVVTTLAPKGHKGAITGVYNTSQCIGSFLGGALTGALWDMGLWYVIGIFVIFSCAAIILTIKMKGLGESNK